MVVILSFILGICFSQGPLIPPGPPGETYKTLGEIEPRTPIKALPYVINAPGSYYLMQNLTYETPGQAGIQIRASNVTIDFMGFSITGPGYTSDYHYCGIQSIGSQNNITIKNGSVYDWKDVGIYLEETTNTLVMNMNIARIGDCGIIGGLNTQMMGCNVSHCVADGISLGNNALVKDCNVFDCFYSIYTSMNSKVINSSVFGNKNGIYVSSGSLVQGCNANMNDGNGFTAGGPSCSFIGCGSYDNTWQGFDVATDLEASRRYEVQILDSTSERNTGDGIRAGQGSNIQRCMINGNGLFGINLAEIWGIIGDQTTKPSYSLIKDCNIFENSDTGIYVYSYAHVVGNTCSKNANGIVVRYQSGGVSSPPPQGPNPNAPPVLGFPGVGNRIEGNSVMENTSEGIVVPQNSGSLVIKNWAYGNVTDYNIGTGNLAGPVVTSDLTINNNAHANFSYPLF